MHRPSRHLTMVCRLLAVLAAAMVAGACHTTTPAPVERRLRVMTYNIQSGGGDLSRVAEVIRRENVDVAALQEVDVHWAERSAFADQAGALAAQLGMEVRFASIYRLPGNAPHAPLREFGVALLSRLPIVSWRNEPLTRLSTQDPHPTPTSMPGLLDATVDVRGQRIRVLDTHLDYRGDPAVRTRQVAEMVRYVNASPLPTVVFGDLNAPPDAAELRPLLERLHDAWPRDAGGGFTYPANAPVKRIDYVLASDHFRIRSAAVIETLASDHRPVVVELVLR